MPGTARFEFKLNRALGTAFSDDRSTKLPLTFVPRGAIVEGVDPRVTARSETGLTIGKASVISKRLRPHNE